MWTTTPYPYVFINSTTFKAKMCEKLRKWKWMKCIWLTDYWEDGSASPHRLFKLLWDFLAKNRKISVQENLKGTHRQSNVQQCRARELWLRHKQRVGASAMLITSLYLYKYLNIDAFSFIRYRCCSRCT